MATAFPDTILTYAGALCASKTSLLRALELVDRVAEAEDDVWLPMDVRRRMSRLEDAGHKPPVLANLPKSHDAYRLYHKILSIGENDLSDILLSDNAQRFSIYIEAAHGLDWDSRTVKLWSRVSLAGSSEIRSFIYEAGASSLDEDIYERFVNIFSKLDDDARFLLDEHEIPNGFFERHGDHLWYEVIDHLKRTGVSGNRLNKASLWDAFDGAQKALTIMLKRHDFYPAFMARVKGSNLAALQRYKSEAPVDTKKALSELTQFIGQHSYTFFEDGKPFRQGEVGGRSLPYILAKALVKLYPANTLEPALSSDPLRAMFYGISGNMLFLRHLENKGFADHLISTDLGL